MNRMSDRKMIYLDDAIDAFRKALCCGEREYAIGFGGIERILNALPTVEPELIYCKDCYHYPGEYADCPMIGWGRTGEDFCSKAERREDE